MLLSRSIHDMQKVTNVKLVVLVLQSRTIPPNRLNGLNT